MAKPTLGANGPGYDGPPIALRATDPDLYWYLTLLHQGIYGRDQGDLDEKNIAVHRLRVNHSIAESLDADDHPQYLNEERHAAIQGNVHGVTAADVGNDEAQWNASALLGRDLAPTPEPADGDVLLWDANGDAWVPATLDLSSVAVFQRKAQTYTPSAGSSAFTATGFLPAHALILGVFATNPFGFSGILSYQIGTTTKLNTWGANATGVADISDIGGFAVNSPYYTGPAAEDVIVSPFGGAWPSSSAFTLIAYYWTRPANP